MVDPSHIETPFVSTWREGMNLCKGLTFANKVEVRRVLTICALRKHHQAQPHDLGRAGHGCKLGCLQEASPTTLNGFQSETEKKAVQSDLRGLCINK